MSTKDLFIVDNSKTEWSVSRYLREWCDISSQFDIATGYFEIGALLDLDGEWQKINKMRILFGGEVSHRTFNAFKEGLNRLIDTLKESIEDEKEKNEFLLGVPAVKHAISKGTIECRFYRKSKFHAKTYITYFKNEIYDQIPEVANVSRGIALVGSSNFTYPGLNQNVELNVQVRNDVNQLQKWFDAHWNEAEEVSSEILVEIERHIKEYSPFQVYLKSMYHYFGSSAVSVAEWEKMQSLVYPILEQYQIDGYNAMLKIADKYGGAFLCDGVGLGKTFVGLMLIERLVIKENKRVVLIVPASARVPVWEVTIKKYIPQILDGFYTFKIINHTDLLLDKNEHLMDQIAEQADCIIIDEAHHFRNRGSHRYRKLFDMIGIGAKKRMYMLTATPINNSFLDLQHLMELFTQRVPDYFKEAPLGIYSLPGHFRKMENSLDKIINAASERDGVVKDAADFNKDAEDIFRTDKLVNELVVQRSRTFVKKSLAQTSNSQVLFPVRKPPVVAEYSLRKSYGVLIEDFIKSFDRVNKKTKQSEPLLSLRIYSPYDPPFFTGDINKIDDMKLGRQRQIVHLIRLLLLKRFESSAIAFEQSCQKIFRRLYRFVQEFQDQSVSTQHLVDRFKKRHGDIIERVYNTDDIDQFIEDADDNFPDYVWEVEENISVKDFDIELLIQDSLSDLEVLALFINDLQDFTPVDDDKLNKLKSLLGSELDLKDKKVIIFSEFSSTARYLYSELIKDGFTQVFQIDGQTKDNRGDIIKRFAPYYNDSCSTAYGDKEIRILISTDVLAEGLNLQDATCLINYDLHWNPVRLMQRIGRVDRRRNADIEQQLLADHPHLQTDREYVFYWNFLPPDELEQLLNLYRRVSQKTLRISKTFGIEGKQLLTPDDDYDALKDFNSAYEGVETQEEEMVLEYESLKHEISDFEEMMSNLPRRIYSGRIGTNVKALFFCYMLPAKDIEGNWSDYSGVCRWYLYDLIQEQILENTYDIWLKIKCNEDEPRSVNLTQEAFKQIRDKMDKHINKTYMRLVQAPVGVKQRLVTWLQLN